VYSFIEVPHVNIKNINQSALAQKTSQMARQQVSTDLLLEQYRQMVFHQKEQDAHAKRTDLHMQFRRHHGIYGMSEASKNHTCDQRCLQPGKHAKDSAHGLFLCLESGFVHDCRDCKRHPLVTATKEGDTVCVMSGLVVGKRYDGRVIEKGRDNGNNDHLHVRGKRGHADGDMEEERDDYGYDEALDEYAEDLTLMMNESQALLLESAENAELTKQVAAAGATTDKARNVTQALSVFRNPQPAGADETLLHHQAGNTSGVLPPSVRRDLEQIQKVINMGGAISNEKRKEKEARREKRIRRGIGAHDVPVGACGVMDEEEEEEGEEEGGGEEGEEEEELEKHDKKANKKKRVEKPHTESEMVVYSLRMSKDILSDIYQSKALSQINLSIATKSAKTQQHMYTKQQQQSPQFPQKICNISAERHEILAKQIAISWVTLKDYMPKTKDRPTKQARMVQFFFGMIHWMCSGFCLDGVVVLDKDECLCKMPAFSVILECIDHKYIKYMTNGLKSVRDALRGLAGNANELSVYRKRMSDQQALIAQSRTYITADQKALKAIK
jgi:hypothetical protein